MNIKRLISLYFIVISLPCLILMGQDLEVEGKVKIATMDAATMTAKQVTRETDGTLSLKSAETVTYAIGDFAQGGVVFWVNPTGKHGKVVNIYNIVGVKWSNIDNVSIGGPALSFINGAGNTVAIIMQSGQTFSAAQHCSNLSYSGYDDWYLPSRDELNQVYANKVAINTTANLNGGESFADNFYWSSSEFSSDSSVSIDFMDGTIGTANKANTYWVRAIRSF